MQIPRREDSLPRFWLLFTVQRKMRRTNRDDGRSAKDNALPARIGDRQWRKRKEERRGDHGVNRTCCFPFALKKSSLRSWMNGIISLRGKLRRVTDRDPFFSCIFSLDLWILESCRRTERKRERERERRDHPPSYP